MCFQDGHLCYVFFRRLDLPGEVVVPGRRRRRFLGQSAVLQEAVLGQIVHALRHLLEVEHLGPPLVAAAFSSLELGLNVHQQIDLLLWLKQLFLPGRVRLFASEDGPQVGLSVPIAQGVQPHESLFSRTPQAQSLTRLDLVPGLGEQL